MRITANSFPNNLVNHLQRLTSQVATLQNQTATGQRITQPSDDPAAAVRVLNFQAERSRIAQYQRNAQRAQDIVNATVAQVRNLLDVSDRATEIVTLSSDVLGPEAHATYAAEINELVEQSLVAANTNFNDEPLFGGTTANARPFVAVRDANGRITSITYNGSATSADYQISEGSRLSPYTDGALVFGEVGDLFVEGNTRYAVAPVENRATERGLINGLNTADARIAALQDDITSQVGSDLTKVNQLLSTIRNLNEQIGRFEVGAAGTALDLRDQRQARLEELSQYLNVEVENVADSAGQIRILSRDAADNPVVLLDASNTFSNLTFDGTNISGGRPSTVLALTGGRLHGGLVARDGIVADLRTDLDRLAAQLVTAVNTAYNPGGTSTNFFDAAGTTAATIAFDPTLTQENIRTSSTADPGANDIALAVAGLATTIFSTGAGAQFNGTFGAYYRGIVATIGNATSNAQGLLDDQTTLRRAILDRRDSVSGVSLDEEIADLTKYQRAFEASARMMRVIDEMLEVVVNNLG